MSSEQHTSQDQDQDQDQDQERDEAAQHDAQAAKPSDAIDGLKDKKPEELTPDELRLMADTMPGEGPGD